MTRQILYRGVALTVGDNETDIEVVRRFEAKLAAKEAVVLPRNDQRDPYAELDG